MKVAVIIPCLNEELTVGKVVEACKLHLPRAAVYVFDNGSSDKTVVQAQRSGAQVIHSPQRGKGHVLRHAFRVLDADYFIMVDGDGTYPVDQAPRLLAFASEYNYEMVMAARLEKAEAKAFRPLHLTGNLLFTGLVRLLFKYPVQDLLTGYRIFSRHFVEQVHLVSRGFEIETELTIRAIAQDLAFAEIPIPYGERPMGSTSKLRTFRDGWLILRTVIRLWRSFRPLAFFSTMAATFLTAGLVGPVKSAQWFDGASILFLGLAFYLQSHLDFERFRILPSSLRPVVTPSTEQEKKSA